jgi:hypothetical protein
MMVLLPAIAIIFSILAFSKPNPEDTANAKGIVTAALATSTWIIYSAFWAYNFTILPYLYMSYLWTACGFIFGILALIYVVQYVSAGFKRKQNEGLRLQQTEGY